MKRSKVWSRSRTILVSRHKEEYAALYKEEQKELPILSYSRDPKDYRRLKAIASSRARVSIMQKYHDELVVIMKQLRAGELK